MKRYHFTNQYFTGYDTLYFSLILGLLTQAVTLVQPKLSDDLIADTVKANRLGKSEHSSGDCLSTFSGLLVITVNTATSQNGGHL